MRPLVLLTAAILALSGCGTKGPLELPPRPAAKPAQPPASAPANAEDSNKAPPGATR